jgi:hypothetical protein
MSSPGAFALLLSAALIWLSTLDGFFPTVVNVTGNIGLSLSLVRSAWMMTILGLLIAVFGCRKRSSLKSTASALLAIGVVAFVLLHGTQFSRVSDRVQTFSSLGSDNSLHLREEMYRYMKDLILSTPLGVGLESSTDVHGASMDSSFAEMFYVLGWPGGCFYLAGFTYLLVQIAFRLRCHSKEEAAAIAVVLACATQAFSGDVIYGQGGNCPLAVWRSLGIFIFPLCRVRWPIKAHVGEPTTLQIGLSYRIIRTVRVTVWVVIAVSDVPVAITATSEVPPGVTTKPLIPHPDRPAARANTPTIGGQSRQRRCVFRSFRLRAKTANPVNPPGHQKAIARRVEPSGLCGS